MMRGGRRVGCGRQRLSSASCAPKSRRSVDGSRAVPRWAAYSGGLPALRACTWPLARVRAVRRAQLFNASGVKRLAQHLIYAFLELVLVGSKSIFLACPPMP